MAVEAKIRSGNIILGDDKVIRKIFSGNMEESLEDAKESIETIKTLSKGDKYPLLVDFSNIRSISPEARAYYASQDAYDATSAAAGLIKSRIGKVIGNFFIGFNKPKYPRKLFNDETEAIEWLKNYTP